MTGVGLYLLGGHSLAGRLIHGYLPEYTLPSVMQSFCSQAPPTYRSPRRSVVLFPILP